MRSLSSDIVSLKCEDLKVILFSRYLKIKLNPNYKGNYKTGDRNLRINKDGPEDIDVDEITREGVKRLRAGIFGNAYN